MILNQDFYVEVGTIYIRVTINKILTNINVYNFDGFIGSDPTTNLYVTYVYVPRHDTLMFLYYSFQRYLPKPHGKFSILIHLFFLVSLPFSFRIYKWDEHFLFSFLIICIQTIRNTFSQGDFNQCTLTSYLIFSIALTLRTTLRKYI